MEFLFIVFILPAIITFLLTNIVYYLDYRKNGILEISLAEIFYLALFMAMSWIGPAIIIGYVMTEGENKIVIRFKRKK